MRAIEGLPFRYAVLALVAILVVGVIIEINKTTTTGINQATGRMTLEINNQINGQFDTKGPDIGEINVWRNWREVCITAQLFDENGIKSAGAYIKKGSSDVEVHMEYSSKSGNYEEWKGCTDKDIYGDVTITVWAIDNSPHENENTKTVTRSI